MPNDRRPSGLIPTKDESIQMSQGGIFRNLIKENAYNDTAELRSPVKQIVDDFSQNTMVTRPAMQVVDDFSQNTYN